MAKPICPIKNFSNLLAPKEPSQPSVKQTGKSRDILEISWKRPSPMNGKPSECQIEFRKIKSCITNKCKRSIHASESISITKQSYPANEDMTIRIGINEVPELDFINKYELKVRESTELGGWGPYSRSLLFEIYEGGTSAVFVLSARIHIKADKDTFLNVLICVNPFPDNVPISYSL